MGLSNDLRANLGKIRPGEDIFQWHVQRLLLQMADNDVDELTRRGVPIFEATKHHFVGKFLDVGCYSGWLFHKIERSKMRDVVDYHGIDPWEEAIQAAKYVFQADEHRFSVANGFDLDQSYDTIWTSQVNFKDFEKIIDILFRHTKRACIFSSHAAFLPEAQKFTEAHGGTLEIIPDLPHTTVVYKPEK